MNQNLSDRVFDNLMDVLDLGTIRNIEMQDIMDWAEEMNDNPHLLQQLVDEMIENGELERENTRSLSQLSFSLDSNSNENQKNQPWCQPIILINDEIPCAQITTEYLQQHYQQQLQTNMIGGNDEEYFEIIRETQRRNRKFNCTEQIVEFKATERQISNFTQAIQVCQNFVNQIHQDYIQPLDNNTRCRIVMDHDAFTSAINFPFMRKSDLSTKLIFDELSKVIQSKKKII